MTDTQGSLPALYHSATSVCSQKVRLALAALGIEHESVLLNLAKGDQFAPAYRQLNPAATVPTWEDRHAVLRDSNAIIWHLIGARPDHALSIRSRDTQTECSDWMDRSHDLHKAIHALTYAMVNRPALVELSETDLNSRLDLLPDRQKAHRLAEIVANGLGSAPVTEGCETVATTLRMLETALAKSGFLAGNAVTAADFALLPFIVRLELLGQSALWLERLPSTCRWLALLKSLEPFDLAIRQFHTPKRMKKFVALPQEDAEEITRRCLRRMS